MPEDPGATRVLADALVAAQRWDRALEVISSGLAADPGDARLQGLLVRTLRAQGRQPEAVQAARALLTLDPDDPYALRLATLVLLDVGWVDEAVGLAGRAVARDPANPANHLALSRAWAQSRRPGALGRQLAAAREAARLDPNSPDAQIQVGVALAADADVAGARAAYREALRLDPGNAAALNNLAVIELQSGSPDSAARHLAAALAADPHGGVARRNLDAVAVRVLRRAGWWLAVAPVPAVLAASGGYATAARVLALLAALGLPLVVARWWRALTPGQRRHLRGLPRRIRWTSWVWPVVAGLVGTLGLAAAALTPGQVSPDVAGGYLVAVGFLAGFRALAAILRPSWRSEVAGRWDRLTGQHG